MRSRLSYSLIALLISFKMFGHASHTYYVSESGNDKNDGLSKTTSWQTLKNIKQTKITSNDIVLLHANDIFKGSIELNGRNGLHDILIDSYGGSKAIIDANDGTGISMQNISGVTIKNIKIKGNGAVGNQGDGILIYTDDSLQKIENIVIENCETSGFHFYGILIQADKNAMAGFMNVNVKNCVATNNGGAGISSLAFYPAISNNNINIIRCDAFNNRGILTKTDNHSGNGIVLSGVDQFNIDSCEAYENGADCRSLGGGPVGIWVWNCSNGTIQNSVSHNNHAGSALHDGGGFDLDGGVSNCSIKNCTSYNNEGAGYLVCEFGSADVYTNNIIENNSSMNDGLKNSYGAITISGASKKFPVTNTIVRNNKISVQNKKPVDGLPAAIFFGNAYCKNLIIENNLFEVSGGSKVLDTDTVFSNEQALFKNNTFNVIGDYKIQCNKCINFSAEEWKQILMNKN